MRWTATRITCALLGLAAAVEAYLAWRRGDWRDLIGQIALAQLAVVLWGAMPPGAPGFQAPTFGTRGMRVALYASLLVTAMAASMRWPAALDDSRGTYNAAILAIAAILTSPFLQAELQRGRSA